MVLQGHATLGQVGHLLIEPLKWLKQRELADFGGELLGN